MCEGYSSRSKRKHSPDMSAKVAQRRRGQVLNIFGRKLRRDTNASEPQSQNPWNSHEELDEGDRPGQRHHVQCFLIVDVVADVQCVPKSKVPANFNSVGEPLFWSRHNRGGPASLNHQWHK